MPNSVDQIEIIDDFKCMVLHNKSQDHFYVVDMDFPSQKYTFKTSNSVKFNIFRQLVQGNELEQLSCIEFLKDELLLAYNINIVSLLAL